MFDRKFSVAAIAMAGGSLLAITPAIAQEANAEGETRGGLNEIVVTAQKRAENIQDIPGSVAAVTEAEMEALGAKNFADIARTIPGVSFSDSGTTAIRPIVRGVASFVGSSTVAITLDDAPLEVRNGANGSPDIRLLDIERVEVLRGPQGTLYGGSSLGGAIRYVLAQPDLDRISGKARAEISNTEHGSPNYEAAAVLSLPLVTDKLGVRVSGVYRQDGGFIDRVTRTPDRTVIDKDINKFETIGGRAAVRFQPVDDFNLVGSVFYQRTRADGESVYNSSLGFARHDPTVTEPSHDRITLYTLRGELGLGAVDLTSVTSYQDRHITHRFDYTTLLPDTGFPSIFGPYYVDDNQKQKVFTQEVRLQSADLDAPFSFIIGGYFTNSKLYGARDVVAEAVLPLEFFGNEERFTTEQLAGFGEVYYRPTEKLKLTAGVRVSRITVRSQQVLRGLAAGSPPPPPSDDRAKQSPIAPKFNVSYEINGDNLVYLQAARGFRPGEALSPLPNSCDDELADRGVSAGGFLKSDKLWTYEAGAKLTTADRRARFNVSGYVTEWKDKPESISLPTCGFSTTANVGRARIKGIELETEFAPGDNVTIGANFGYTDATYAIADPLTGFFDGDPLPVVPKWTAAVNAEYRFDLGNWNNFARVDLVYRDKYAVGSVQPGFIPTVKPYTDAYEYVNLRVGGDNGRWNWALFVNNLFDVRPVVHRYELTPLSRTQDRITTLRPRTIGLSTGVSF